MNLKLAWPAVVALLGAMAAIAAMAIAGVSVTVISVTVVPLAMLLLTAFTASIAATMQSVKEQTNGQQATLTALVERFSRMLAAANVPSDAIAAEPHAVPGPPVPAPVPSTVDTTAVDVAPSTVDSPKGTVP